MIVGSSPAASRERHWIEYADEIGYLDGTDPLVRIGITERMDEHEYRDVVKVRARPLSSPFRPNLFLAFYHRNPALPIDSVDGWHLIGEYRIWRYWCEVEGKKRPRAKVLKVLTGEALPGIWLPTENPFNERQDEQRYYGMVVTRDAA